MELEMEVQDTLSLQLERMDAAAQRLEQAAGHLAALDLQATAAQATREAGLEQRLREAEATIATLRAAAAAHNDTQGAGPQLFSQQLPGPHYAHPERKTTPAGVTAALLSKPGITLEAMHSGSHTGSHPGMDTATLDTALVSLPVEQRIAVKAQLLRAGLLA